MGGMVSKAAPTSGASHTITSFQVSPQQTDAAPHIHSTSSSGNDYERPSLPNSQGAPNSFHTTPDPPTRRKGSRRPAPRLDQERDRQIHPFHRGRQDQSGAFLAINYGQNLICPHRSSQQPSSTHIRDRPPSPSPTFTCSPDNPAYFSEFPLPFQCWSWILRR